MNRTKRNAEYFFEIIKNTDLESKKQNEDIVIKDFIFEGELIDVYNETISSPVLIKNCEFEVGFFKMQDCGFMQDLTFESCKFYCVLYMNNIEVKASLNFCGVQMEKVHISKCAISKVNIARTKINTLTVDLINIENLNTGGYMRSNKIDSLLLINTTNSCGSRVEVLNDEIGKLTLNGINKSSVFNFEEITCNNINIEGFHN
ncbi:MAG: hypothetical protein ACOXZK_06995 [Bacteroidales bacterium]